MWGYFEVSLRGERGGGQTDSTPGILPSDVTNLFHHHMKKKKENTQYFAGNEIFLSKNKT